MAHIVPASVIDHLFDLAKQLVGGSTAIPKSVARLIDTVGEQVGLLAGPRHVRRNAEAQAADGVTLAKAGLDDNADRGRRPAEIALGNRVRPGHGLRLHAE